MVGTLTRSLRKWKRFYRNFLQLVNNTDKTDNYLFEYIINIEKAKKNSSLITIYNYICIDRCFNIYI